MTGCLNMNLPEYQLLKKQAGISEDELKYFIRGYRARNKDKLPTLDEIPDANSEPYIRELLGIQNDVVELDKLLKITGTKNIKQASSYLNNIFRDRNIKLLQLGEGVKVTINKRNIGETDPNFTPITHVNSIIYFNEVLTKLANDYGITINTVDQSTVLSGAEQAKAYVHDGQIYLNVDNATVEDPIHELMHIFLGHIKSTEADKYYNIVNSIEQLPNYQELAGKFPYRAKSDVNEEIFVREIAKSVLGLPSALDGVDKSILAEIESSAIYTLDLILQGNLKAQNVTNLFGQPLKAIANLVQSKTMQNYYQSTLNVDGAAIQRKLANLKSELIESKKLKENCS